MKSFDFVQRQKRRIDNIHITGFAPVIITFRKGTKHTAGDVYYTNHDLRNICVYVYRVSEYLQTTSADQITAAYQIICCELSQGD